MRSRIYTVAAVSCLFGSLLVGIPSRAAAQADTAHVSYRTREIVFVTAGRTRGLAVGDTIDLLALNSAVAARAVVISTSLASASARLLNSDVAIAVGDRVQFAPHAAPEVAAAAPLPAPDTLGGAPPESAAAPPESPAIAPRGSAGWRETSRWRGGFQLDQIATSSGGAASLTSQQTVGGFSLTAPLARGFELRTRASGRWRGGAAGTTTGLAGFSSIVYQLEARLTPPGGRWSASVGRFVPQTALGLGYTDGASLDLRFAPGQHIGLIAGFVPLVDHLRFSSATRRGAVYWAFGEGGSLSGALAATAEWEGGARRKTVVSGQTFWRPSGGLSLSLYGDVDLGAPWRPDSGATVSSLYANLRVALPFGLRAGLGVESHQAVRLWETFTAGDTTSPSGRLNGLALSLGGNVARLALDVSASYLKRATDATPTWRGTLSVSRGGFFLMAAGQHGDLFDYGSVTARILLPSRGLPVNASLGVSTSMTKSAGGGLTLWRYSFQPELSRRLGGGLFVSAGGDIGSYAGRTATYLHAGLSYRFR